MKIKVSIFNCKLHISQRYPDGIMSVFENTCTGIPYKYNYIRLDNVFPTKVWDSHLLLRFGGPELGTFLFQICAHLVAVFGISWDPRIGERSGSYYLRSSDSFQRLCAVENEIWYLYGWSGVPDSSWICCKVNTYLSCWIPLLIWQLNSSSWYTAASS